MRMIEFLSRLSGILSLRFDPTLRLGDITADKRLHISYQMETNIENGTIAQGSAHDSICNKTKKKFLIIRLIELINYGDEHE